MGIFFEIRYFLRLRLGLLCLPCKAWPWVATLSSAHLLLKCNSTNFECLLSTSLNLHLADLWLMSKYVFDLFSYKSLTITFHVVKRFVGSVDNLISIVRAYKALCVTERLD